MRKHPILTGFIGTVLVLIATFLLGPSVDLDTTLHPVDLPENLDSYLAEREASVADLTPGTEKTIIWADSVGARTPLSVVYLHGYSATRQETAPLSDSIASALGANLFYTRLTGHGRTGDAMMDGSVNAWVNDAWEAYEIGRRLGDRVVLVSVSTGGTLATWLVAQPDTEALAANVMISPNFRPASAEAGLLTLPWGEQLADAFGAPEHSWEPANERQGRFWTTTYPTKALIPMMGLVKLAHQQPLEANTLPTLMVYSTKDDVVDPEAIRETYERFGGEKKLVVYDESENNSHHVLAGDILSPGSTAPLADMAVQFIESNIQR